jgi:hypothetical protein
MATLIDLKRVKSDINGNPRYVCHFLNFQKEGEKVSYEMALQRSRQIGGRKYNNKAFGGGIVFQSYNVDELAKQIIEIRDKN